MEMEAGIPNSSIIGVGGERILHRSATIATGGNLPDQHPSRPPQDQSPQEEIQDSSGENDISALNMTNESLETTAVENSNIHTSTDLAESEENPIFNVNDISFHSSVHGSVTSEECKFDPEAASTLPPNHDWVSRRSIFLTIMKMKIYQFSQWTNHPSLILKLHQHPSQWMPKVESSHQKVP